jgi:predicted nucleic acid-binding protein
MGNEDRVFLDTNVVLDHLADRQPFAEYAHRIFGFAESREITLYLSALSFSHLYYILRKIRGHAGAISLLERLEQLVSISSVGESEVKEALAANFNDLEDAIQYCAAKSESDIVAILTRDRDGFARSEIPAMTPEEYLRRRQALT